MTAKINNCGQIVDLECGEGQKVTAAAAKPDESSNSNSNSSTKSKRSHGSKRTSFREAINDNHSKTILFLGIIFWVMVIIVVAAVLGVMLSGKNEEPQQQEVPPSTTETIAPTREWVIVPLESSPAGMITETSEEIYTYDWKISGISTAIPFLHSDSRVDEMQFRFIEGTGMYVHLCRSTEKNPLVHEAMRCFVRIRGDDGVLDYDSSASWTHEEDAVASTYSSYDNFMFVVEEPEIVLYNNDTKIATFDKQDFVLFYPEVYVPMSSVLELRAYQTGPEPTPIVDIEYSFQESTQEEGVEVEFASGSTTGSIGFLGGDKYTANGNWAAMTTAEIVDEIHFQVKEGSQLYIQLTSEKPGQKEPDAAAAVEFSSEYNGMNLKMATTWKAWTFGLMPYSSEDQFLLRVEESEIVLYTNGKKIGTWEKPWEQVGYSSVIFETQGSSLGITNFKN
jgi:hypothetical protein